MSEVQAEAGEEVKLLTLGEKQYGPGYRAIRYAAVKAPWTGCAAEVNAGHPCNSEVYGSVEMYVDDYPPALDWYTRLLGKLPQNVWTTVRFCQSHLADVTQRSVYEAQDEPDLWAPWRENPFILTHPPKLLVPHGGR